MLVQFLATTAFIVKAPAGRSLLAHIHYLRELLDRAVLEELWWADSRDMLADGLTKGAVNREALNNMMKGMIATTQSVHSWKSLLQDVKP